MPRMASGLFPDLSVVIPSHNRRDRLAETVRALEQQTLEPARYEVIVSLDGATDGSEAMLAALETPFRLRAWSQPAKGAAAARNAGAALAAGEIILFLDDDIEADPGLLKAHLDAREQPGDVVIGYSKPRLAREDRFYEQSLRNWWEDLFIEMASPGHRFGYQDLLSGNVSIPRALFEKVGRFDEGLACREDYELGRRLVQAGARLRFAQGALGHHHDATTLARGMARAMREGEGDLLFARRHPDLLPELDILRPGRIERVTRQFAFRLPLAADALAHSARHLLPLFEALRARGRWGRLYGWLRRYWYMRGVAARLGSLEAYRALVADMDARLRDSPHTTLNLADGLPSSAEPLSIEAGRPVAVLAGARQIATLPRRVGAEPPATHHLRRTLGDRVDDWAWHVAADRIAPPWSACEQDGCAAPLFPSSAHAEEAEFVGEIEMEGWRITPPLPPNHHPARLLVRRGGRPLGWVVQPTAAEGEDRSLAIRAATVEQLRGAILRDDVLQGIGGNPEPGQLPPISVVICTRDRTDYLRRCLAAFAELDYPEFELIVVDNAPRTGDTEALLRDHPNYRYVREERPGLDWARNRGLAEARHEIVAFTDDDTRVDRLWLRGVARAFSNPEVKAMTGLVAPMQLDTPAQRWFEEGYGGMGKGMRPRWFRGAGMSPSELLWASRCGVGANMAMRKSLVAEIGGFDPALDVGTASRGGGDIEFFHRVMARGHTLLYEPGALIWHQHRESWQELHKQVSDNGCAFVAYLITCARNRTVPRRMIIAFAVRNWLGGWLLPNLRAPVKHARWLARGEIKGALQGYRAYRNARREAARLAAPASDGPPLPEKKRSSQSC
jgi:GT2 family glycosyltransferase